MTGLIALIVGASLGATAGILYRRRTLVRLLRQMGTIRRTVDEMAIDTSIAEWCRHMNLTVITVSGTEYTTSFRKLWASEAPTMRSWNVPVSVSLWSDLDANLILPPGKDETHG